jgi:cytidine deaminase
MHPFDTEAVRLWLNPRRIIPEDEHFNRFWQLREHLVIRAREAAAKYALSWRNFIVGCAVFAYDSKRTEYWQFGTRWKIFTGCNFKPFEDGHNVCAEQIAIGAAVNEGYERIIGMALVGEPQPDGETGLKGKTLYPCKNCRAFFQALPQVRSDTIIISATRDEREPIEVYTVEDLLKLHDGPKTGESQQ